MEGFGIHMGLKETRVVRVIFSQISLHNAPRYLLMIGHWQPAHISSQRRDDIFSKIIPFCALTKEARLKINFVKIMQNKAEYLNRFPLLVFFVRQHKNNTKFLQVAYVVKFMPHIPLANLGPLFLQYMCSNLPLFKIIRSYILILP